MTIARFLSENSKRIWSGRHRTDSLHKMQRFFEFEDFGSRDVGSFKPADIYRFSDSLLEQGVAKATINRYYAAISAVFKHAVMMEEINHAPKIKWFKEGNGRPRYLTDEEITGLLEFFDGHKQWWMLHFCVLALNTGMRLGEIRKITKDDIKQDESGKWWCYLEVTKNGDDRYVPLNSRAMKALESLDYQPSLHYSHTKFYDAWAEARHHVARRDNTFVFHVLRHTAATNMANDLGVNTLLIAQILGHRTLKTTEKYVHSKPQTLQDIMGKLGA